MNVNQHVQRKELKFLLSPLEYVHLSRKLAMFLKKDRHFRKPGGYFIRSLYFDTLDDDAFHEKDLGIEFRKKYRLRIYDLDAQTVKFEIKRKKNNIIVKDSATITREDAIQVQKGTYACLLRYNNPVLDEIYSGFLRYCMVPVAIIDYERQAYVSPMHNLRCTFDLNVRSNQHTLSLFSKDIVVTTKLKEGHVIFELKYDQELPLWVRDIIRMDSFVHSAISKYSIGRLSERFP